jgi:signal transduction histidine kinase
MSVATGKPLDQARGAGVGEHANADSARMVAVGARRSDAPASVERPVDGRRPGLSLRWRLVVAAALPLVIAAVAVAAVLTAGAGGAAGSTVGVVLALILGGVLGMTLAGAAISRWLRPRADIAATASRATGADADAAFPGSDADELVVLAAAVDTLVADVAASRQELGIRAPARTRLLEQLINAQEEERKRIARELHDGVGQALLSLMVGLKLIVDTRSLEAAQAKAEDLRGVVSESLEQVRTLSRELRPSVLDDLGLAVALDRYTAEFSGRHPLISVDLHCDLTDRVPSVVETALYRIVQEAMTNAARHGECDNIGVLLTRREGSVQAIIEDDGEGFDVETARRAGRSVGLHGMAERAELVGGKLDIESNSEGTTVYVEVPV